MQKFTHQHTVVTSDTYLRAHEYSSQQGPSLRRPDSDRTRGHTHTHASMHTPWLQPQMAESMHEEERHRQRGQHSERKRDARQHRPLVVERHGDGDRTTHTHKHADTRSHEQAQRDARCSSGPELDHTTTPSSRLVVIRRLVSLVQSSMTSSPSAVNLPVTAEPSRPTARQHACHRTQAPLEAWVKPDVAGSPSVHRRCRRRRVHAVGNGQSTRRQTSRQAARGA
jgi:hypothetical protein